MRTEFRKLALALLALLCAGVAHAKTVDPAFDLAREGSLYICPNDDLVDGQFYTLASECLQNGASFRASTLGGGVTQGAANPPFGRFWEDNLYLYNPTSGAYTFLGAFMTPINLSYGGESPFYELPFDVKNIVWSFISHGDSVIDIVSESDGVTTAFYLGGSGLPAFELASIPETTTWTMMLVGFGAMGAAIRIMRRKNGLALAE